MAATASLLRGRADRYVVCWQVAELAVKGHPEEAFVLPPLDFARIASQLPIGSILRMNAPKPPDLMRIRSVPSVHLRKVECESGGPTRT
jgi:hypothetical protein